MCYLSEGLAVPLASLLSEDRQLLVLLVPPVDFIETGQEAHQQHEGNQAQQGEDGHSEGGQLVGWIKTTEEDEKPAGTTHCLPQFVF